MTKTTLQTTATILTASMLLSSCAATKDGRVTQAQGAGVGAVLGGALLGGLGYALTGSTSTAMRMATVGAAVGGVSGFAYGTEVAAKKAAYASQEDYLTFAIGEAETRNATALQENQALESQVQSLEQQIKSQPPAKEQKKLKLQMDNVLGSIGKSEKKYDAWITDLNGALAGDGYSSKPQAATLRTQIKKLEGEKAALQAKRSRVAASKALLSV